MKKKCFIAAVLLSALYAVQVCAQDSQVLMTIDGEPIFTDEFMYIYTKNNQESALEKKSKEEYKDLFINFKLKVKEAMDQGIDTTEAFKRELKGYRAQATPKYMRDDAAIDSMVMLSYGHMTKDRRAAHIAIVCPKTATDSANQAAWEKINTIRERVTIGLPKQEGKGKKVKTTRQPENFMDVAAEVSEDPGLAQTKGELGWIQPFHYVYSLESAVYSTPVGEVTPVFRSPFGYHIALVEEELKHEEVRAAHIMKMTTRGNEASKISAQHAIDSLYQLLEAGADFAQLASENSDDKGSAMRGGDLGWFVRGTMISSLENAAFSLPDSGMYSKPFESEYGWHILLKKGQRGILPLDSIRPQVLKNVQRDERMQEAEKIFIQKARAEYQLPDTMSDKNVMEYVDSQLENKYPEFKNLVREYHDGILLFEVSLKEVWDKASQDTKGLTHYFKAHKQEYTWSVPRYKGYLVSCANAAAAKAAKAIIKNCMRTEPDSIDSYINNKVNRDSVTYVQFKRGLWERGINAAVDKYGFGDKTAQFEPTEEFPIVFTVGKILKNPECYMDERSRVTTDYQDELEKTWVETLRAKHDIVWNDQVFDSLQ